MTVAQMRAELAERLVLKCRAHASKKHRFTRACHNTKMQLCMCGYHEGSLTWA